MKINSNGFTSEIELVHCYDRKIQKAIKNLNLDIHTQYEVSAPGCIPDLILYNTKYQSIQYLITFEFKLSNWRRAISQAFRHRNFGNESYVVIDQEKSRPAILNLGIFKKANIGLITMDSLGSLLLWYSPEPKLPFSIEFSYIVASTLLSPYKITSSDLIFTKSLQGETNLSELKNTWQLPVSIAAS